MTDTEEVIRFLRQNPGFFEENRELLDGLAPDGPVDGALFYEKQLRVLKERENRRQSTLDMIVDNARSNLELESELLGLAVSLLAEGSPPPDPAARVCELLRERFAMDAVEILNGAGAGEASAGYEEVRQRVLHKSSVCDDRVSSRLLNDLFAGAGGSIQSCAFIPLVYKTGLTGVLVLGSVSPQRFTPDAGVLFLDRLGQLVAGYLHGRGA